MDGEVFLYYKGIWTSVPDNVTHVRMCSTVPSIDSNTFWTCSQLTNVELNEGLKQIDKWAFSDCTSLQSIIIPSTVKFIHNKAFDDCTSLVAIEFCEEIEQFMNEHELFLPRWNRGVSEALLRTYSFLARRNIPARLDTLKLQTWKLNIHEMLQRIPEEWKDDDVDNDADAYYKYEEEEDNEEDNDSEDEEEEDNIGQKFFDVIESRLANYEHLQDVVAPILELALWKSKMSEQLNSKGVDTQMKLQCRYNSLSMVSIIIPNALSFL